MPRRIRWLSVLGLTLLARTGFAEEPDLYDIEVFRTFELTFPFNDWYQRLEQNYQTGNYVEADLVVDGVLYPKVGVAFRGQLAYFTKSKKKPLKIKMDAFVPGQELYGYDTMRLNNGSEEPSFCRTAVMSNVLGEYMPMPRVNFAHMVMQGQNYGVYINEQVKDRAWMDQYYRSKDGNRYKFGGGDLSYLGDKAGPYKSQYELQNDPGINPWDDLIELCDVLNNTALGPTLTDALREVCDVDGSIWEIAGDNVFVNLDSYYVNRNNFFVIQDQYHGLMELVNHDLNLCLGTWRGGYNLEPNYQFSSTYPMVKRPMSDDALLQEYYAHVLTLAEEALTWDRLQPLFAHYQDIIRDAVFADKKKIFTDSQFTSVFTQNVQGEWFTIPAIEPFVRDRHDFLMNHAKIGGKKRVDFGVTQHSPSHPTPGQPVTVTAEILPTVKADAVEVRWRVQGAWIREPLYDDGAHGDGAAGDDVFGAILPGQPSGTLVEYYFVATTGSGGVRFEPAKGARGAIRYRVYGAITDSLRVNEFVADNDSGDTDEFGENDDWVEIVNTGSTNVDLTGKFLSDDITQLTNWPLPAGIVLPAGQMLRVWCDGEPQQGPLHASFKLSAGGEEVVVTDSDGVTVLDSIGYGPVLPDQSLGRLFDGTGPWVTTLDTTPGTLNDPGCGARRYDFVDSDRNPVELSLGGTVEEGEFVDLAIRKGPALGLAFLYVSLAPAELDLGPKGVLMVDLAQSLSFRFRLDAQGSLDLSAQLADDGSLLGIDFYLQALTVGLGGPIQLSNAVEMEVCPGQ